MGKRPLTILGTPRAKPNASKDKPEEKPKGTRLGDDFGLGLAAAFEVCPYGPCRQGRTCKDNRGGFGNGSGVIVRATSVSSAATGLDK